MNSNFASNLKGLRHKMNMSVDELLKRLAARGFKYDKQSVYKWEKGDAEPSIDVIVALSKILKCDIAYLLDDVHGVAKRLSNYEVFLLKVFRCDEVFHDIIMKIIKRRASYSFDAKK